MARTLKPSWVPSMDTTALYQEIVEQAPDAIIFADPKGIIQLWNAGAEAVFGYSASEALGQSLNLIVPEDLRQAHWSGFDLAMKVGRTKHIRQILTTRSIHKTGSRIYVNLSFSVIQDREEKVKGALATGRDFTVRYLEEKALRKKLAELEHKYKVDSP